MASDVAITPIKESAPGCRSRRRVRSRWPHPGPPAYGGSDAAQLRRLLHDLGAEGLVLPPEVGLMRRTAGSDLARRHPPSGRAEEW